MSTIETERFILRPFLETDVQDIFELDSDLDVHRYLGYPTKSMEEAQATVAYVQNQYKKDGLGRWAVIDKKTNEFIGWSGLKYEREVRDNMDYYDLGYRLKKKYWGKGIATETALASLKYGFETLNLNEIFAGAHVDNIGSNKVLQKVGLQLLETFEYEGVPHHWYSINKEGWQKR